MNVVICISYNGRGRSGVLHISDTVVPWVSTAVRGILKRKILSHHSQVLHLFFAHHELSGVERQTLEESIGVMQHAAECILTCAGYSTSAYRSMKVMAPKYLHRPMGKRVKNYRSFQRNRAIIYEWSPDYTVVTS